MSTNIVFVTTSMQYAAVAPRGMTAGPQSGASASATVHASTTIGPVATLNGDAVQGYWLEPSPSRTASGAARAVDDESGSRSTTPIDAGASATALRIATGAEAPLDQVLADAPAGPATTLGMPTGTVLTGALLALNHGLGVLGLASGARQFGAELSSARLDPGNLQAADLITSFVPFGLSTLDHAIERYLAPADDLDPPADATSVPSREVRATLTVAAAALALDVAVRVRRARRRTDEQDGEPGASLVPGLPGLWRMSRP